MYTTGVGPSDEGRPDRPDRENQTEDMNASREKPDPTEEIVIPVSGPGEETGPGGQDAVDPGDRPGSPEEHYLDRLQRLQAEFANYRRRNGEERKSLFAVAKGEMAQKLLPVLDDFERLIHHQNGDWETDLQGIRLIYQNLKKALNDEGLEEIPAEGEAFDPEIHEAVGVQETDADGDGRVLEVWQRGYRLGGRMLRPSRVKVGRESERDSI